MKFAFRLILFFVLNVGFVACSLLPNELKTAEQLIETAPDSALHILRHLSPGKYKSGENRALYGLLLMEALDKKQLSLTPDSLLDFAIGYYEKHPDKDRLATCYFFRGRSYKYHFQYEKATNFYLKALDELQASKNNRLLGKVNMDLGEIYNIQRDFSLARQKFKIAYSCFEKDSLQPMAFYALLYVGRTYYEAHDYRKAGLVYQRILTRARDSIQQGVLLQEMGLNFYDYKKPDSAIVYFRKAIHYPYIKNNRAIRYYFLSRLYFDLGQTDSAFYYAKSSFDYQPDIRTQRECYRIMTNSEYLRGNMESMSGYMNKYVVLGDSLRKIDAQTKGSYLEVMHHKTLEIVETRSRLWYMIILFLASLAIAYYIIYKIRHKNKKVIEQKEEDHLQQKADMHKEALQKQRNALLRKIEDKKTAQSALWKKAGLDERKAMDIEIYEELLYFDRTALFNKEMDIILNNLITKLQTKYPGLNAKEIQWCCLHLLEIPVNDIMLLLDYNVEGLKKMRQRLAKKVDVRYVSQIDDFLQAVLVE
ncbi:MAG: hypothetical protein QM800_15815 [Paludibacter sp.]